MLSLQKLLKYIIMSEKEIKKSYQHTRGVVVGFWSVVLLIALFLFLKKADIVTSSYWSAFATWPLILFVVSIFWLLKRRWVAGIFLLFAAVFFWIPLFKAQFPDLLPMIPAEGFLHDYWYLLIVVFAFLMLIKQLFFRKRDHSCLHQREHWEYWNKTNLHKEHASMTSEAKEGFIQSNVVFNSNDRIYLNEDFTGGNFSAVFGSQKIDLRKCVIRNNEKAYLKVEVVFGNCEIWIPSDWKLQFEVDGIFSSIEDNRHEKPMDSESKNTLVVQGSCVFSSLEIRN